METEPTASNRERATDIVLEHYQIPCVSLKNSFINKKKKEIMAKFKKIIGALILVIVIAGILWHAALKIPAATLAVGGMGLFLVAAVLLGAYLYVGD